MILSLCHWKHGVTAYFGLVEVGGMKAGDTVAISAAAGSVSQNPVDNCLQSKTIASWPAGQRSCFWVGF